MLVHLFIKYIKKKFKFLLIHNIAIVIPFNYPAYNIIIFFFVNACLAKDLFKELKIDF